MIPLYLNQSAHIIDQICESDVTIPTPLKKQNLQYENRINRLATCIVLLAVVCKKTSQVHP